MIKEELDTIETHLKELEALRDFERIKDERDSQAVEIAELKERVGQLNAELTGETREHKKTRAELKKRKAETRELNRELTRTRKELINLKEFQSKVTGAGVPLQELQQRFLQAQETEIEARTKANEEKTTMQMESRMPNLVKEKFADVVRSGDWPPEVEDAIITEAEQLADEIMRNRENWPRWFKDYFLGHVKEETARRLDVEFDSRVAAEVEHMIGAVKEREWEWEPFSTAKAYQLSINLKSMVTELHGPWYGTCDRCGGQGAVTIGPTEIAQLLADRTVDITCPSCTDIGFLFSTIPHTVLTFDFQGLLRAYLGESPPCSNPS